MIYSYVTDTTQTQVWTGTVREAVVQVNAALTGTIKVIDNTTGSTANVATITNPTVGSVYRYYGLTQGLRVVASTLCDVTVSANIGRAGV